MLVGQYFHSLDHKSRTSIPKKFRQELKNQAILTRGLDGCLFLYSSFEWEKLSARVSELPLTGADARAFSRYIFSGAVETTFDALGRIMIPDYLCRYADLEKELVSVGVLNRVEIWSKKRFLRLEKKLLTNSESIAEKLTETGV